SSSGLSGEALPGTEVGNPLGHRTYDSPPAEERAERDGGVGTEDDPKRNTELPRRGAPWGSDRGDEEDECDDPHPFLSVVRPVRHAVEEARDELKPPERMVHSRRRLSAEDTDDHEREAKSEDEPHERRGDHVYDNLDQSLQEDPSEDDRGDKAGEETGQDEGPEGRPLPPDDGAIREERGRTEHEGNSCHE